MVATMGIIVAALGAVALRRIEWAVLAIAAIPFFVSQPLPTGTNAQLPVSLVAALLIAPIWLIQMLIRKQIRLVPSRSNLPVLLFIAVSIFSLLASGLFYRAQFFAWRQYTSGIGFIVVQLSGLILLILLPLMFLIALNLFQGPQWIRRIFILMLIPAVPALLVNVLNLHLGVSILGLWAPGLYHMWLIALLYSQLLVNPALTRWQRVGAIGLIVAWLSWAFVLRLENISFWAPTFLALLLLTGIKSKKALIIVLAVTALPFIVGYGYYYQHVYVKAQTMDFNRFWLWPTIIGLVVRYASPVIGAGPVGYYPYIVTLYPDQAMSAHNNYVDIFGETGIVGFSLFIWMLVSILRTGWKLHRMQPDGFNRAFSTGAMAGLAGMMGAMMLNDWFLPFIYNGTLLGFDWDIYAWIMLGAMVGMEHWLTTRANGMERSATS